MASERALVIDWDLKYADFKDGEIADMPGQSFARPPGRNHAATAGTSRDLEGTVMDRGASGRA